MIPTLIIILLRRYQKNNPAQFLVLKAKVFYTVRIVLFTAMFFLLVLVIKAQEKKLSYIIKRNGNRVGSMIVKEVWEGKKQSLRLQSDVKTSFLFTVSAKGIEEARYENGVMVYSSVYQKLNGNEKINKQIRLINNSYHVYSKGKEERLNNLRIYYNLLCIYTNEPLRTAWVFSDRYQKFLSIQKIKDHHYRIKFPDGSSNDYWFANGMCTKIEVDHFIYSAVMELNQ